MLKGSPLTSYRRLITPADSHLKRREKKELHWSSDKLEKNKPNKNKMKHDGQQQRVVKKLFGLRSHAHCKLSPSVQIQLKIIRCGKRTSFIFLSVFILFFLV